jgi:hypothetical protein
MLACICISAGLLWKYLMKLVFNIRKESVGIFTFASYSPLIAATLFQDVIKF